MANRRIGIGARTAGALHLTKLTFGESSHADQTDRVWRPVESTQERGDRLGSSLPSKRMLIKLLTYFRLRSSYIDAIASIDTPYSIYGTCYLSLWLQVTLWSCSQSVLYIQGLMQPHHHSSRHECAHANWCLRLRLVCSMYTLRHPSHVLHTTPLCWSD